MEQTLKAIDDFIWGIPLIVLILAVGIYLTIRLKGLQIAKLGLAVKQMFKKNENGAEGETSSFGALCVALSATIGTGNIVGVATAIVAGGPFYYIEKCMEYLVGNKPKVLLGYRWLYIIAIFIGPFMTVSAVWTIADIFNGLMAFPNLIALVALGGVVIAETKKYFGKKK